MYIKQYFYDNKFFYFSTVLKNLTFLFLTFLFAGLLSSCIWENTDSDPDYLPIDDSEYPYADLPRLVIETDDFHDIRDKESKHRARMQIWGKDAPESEIIPLSIKGRGNSSVKMSKFNMKLEFDEKLGFGDIPPNKDWVLVSNHADKSLLRNFITLKLAQWLEMDFVPRSQFVEVYLNRGYEGLYLIMEKIKVGKDRVNIPKDENHYLVEVDRKYNEGEQIIKTELSKLPFKVHWPKVASDSSLKNLKNFLDNWESFMRTDYSYKELISQWIDLQEYTKYYWIEEFSKNVDSNLKTSVYFTWERGGLIKMGPVWDFDLSYGEYRLLEPEYWYSNWNPWNKHLFKNKEFKQYEMQFWRDHRDIFVATLDSIKLYRNDIEKAARNNFKRFPVLDATLLWEFNQSFESYDEAVEFLIQWIKKRIDWIDKQLN